MYLYSAISLNLDVFTTSVINVMVSVLASSAFGSKPKTVKLVFADSNLDVFV
jgi:hypothetical protein